MGWASRLRGLGFETAACAGPDAPASCPRLVGDRCPLREWADVALLVGVEEPAAFRGWPEVACTRLKEDGATVTLDPEVGLRPVRRAGEPALGGQAVLTLLRAVLEVDRCTAERV
jgi:hypothetical protein